MGTARTTPRRAVIALRVRLAAILLGVLAVLGAGAAGSARASASTPYFTALPASGGSELQVARGGAVSAGLPDGRVLIAGGNNGVNDSGFLASAELFDPASDTFTALTASGNTELQTARSGAVSAPLPDGQVLIAGGNNGDDGTGFLSSAELFDPASDTFTALPASGSTELQTARGGAMAAPLPDGQILIAGGYNDSGFLASAELFDPVSDTFTALPASGSTELQTPRAFGVASLLPDGEVLIAGGKGSAGFLATAELFDPASDTFTALPASGGTELQTARALAVAALLPDGQVLIAGGQNASGFLASAELFDPAADAFTALPASGSIELQSARALAVAASLPDGQVLIAGGQDASGYLQSAERYSSAPQAAAAGGDFGDQTIGEPSPTSVIVVSNVGAQTLRIAAVSLGGADPGDFQISTDACSGQTLALKQSCTISARFTPATVANDLTATITLSDNEPTAGTVTLTGNGIAANTGPGGPIGATGATGTAGTAGPKGATGSRGRSGEVELVTCKSVQTGKRGHKKTTQRCTTRLTRSPVKFTTSQHVTTAVLSRGSVVYATGTAIRVRNSTQLLLAPRRKIRKGSYTLTLTHARTRRHQAITID